VHDDVAPRLLRAAEKDSPVRREHATVELIDEVEGAVGGTERVAVDLEAIARRTEGQRERRRGKTQAQGKRSSD